VRACKVREANILHEQFLAPVFDKGEPGSEDAFMVGVSVRQCRTAGYWKLRASESLPCRRATAFPASWHGRPRLAGRKHQRPLLAASCEQDNDPAAMAARDHGALTRI
jgi:hypothetical protein